MKRTFILPLIVAAMMLPASTACVSVNSSETDGSLSISINRRSEDVSNNIITKNLKLGDFNEIEVSRVNIVYSVGTPGTATLSAPDNVMDKITVSTRGGKLKVNVSDEVNFRGRLNATLTVSSSSIKEIDAALSSNVKVTTPIVYSGGLDLEATTSALIVLGEVKSEEADIEVSTSGCVKIADLKCADEIDVSASTSGSVKIAKATSKGFDGEATTSGTVKVECGSIGDVDLDASTSGSIKILAAVSGGTADASTGGTIKVNTSNISKTTSTGGRISGL